MKVKIVQQTIRRGSSLQSCPVTEKALIAYKSGSGDAMIPAMIVEIEVLKGLPVTAQTVLLAFQHYIVMLGSVVMIATILVPRMGGGPGDKARVIQSLLFMSGINTLLQTFLGTRLPTVMGPSFAYVISVFGIINDFSDSNFSSEHQRFLHCMRSIQGSLIVSSFINIILGYGRVWANLTRLFSPVVIVPVVCVVGLGLFGRGFPQLANCVEIGLPMLILFITVCGFKVY
uniref:Uncharacterized protein n=1 Tax=Daucus carota subsp. sativus TaxID=79200 RepID=A0A166GB67_DAUCS